MQFALSLRTFYHHDTTTDLLLPMGLCEGDMIFDERMFHFPSLTYFISLRISNNTMLRTEGSR